mmetsp:Transcript_29113/g.21656  ORF Transcript_29113/g.21656 Transcript_29113/m.21656 type:complete len:308 (-) Transcript_29113:98-1021(-)
MLAGGRRMMLAMGKMPTFVPKIAGNSKLRMVHEAAANGFTASSTASYEQGRPEYSDDSLAQIASILRGSRSGAKESNSFHIIELGAGTGKFTQSFSRYASTDTSISLDYIATEPSPGFRQALIDKQIPRTTVRDATGENMSFAGSDQIDLVIAAQAFHWMDNAHTLREIHRVLQPRGSFAMIWNSYDYNFDWITQLDKQILTPAYGADTPRQQTGRWRDCFFLDETRPLFSNLHSWYQPYVQVGNREMVINRIFSTSVIVLMSESEQAKVRKTLEHILDTHPELETARKTGTYQIPYVTHLAWVTKK